MADYQVNLQEALLAFLGDPQAAADLFLDIVDEQVEAGTWEGPADIVKEALEPALVAGFTYLQGKLASVQITAED